MRKLPESEETDIFLVTPRTNACYWPSFGFIVFFYRLYFYLPFAVLKWDTIYI